MADSSSASYHWRDSFVRLVNRAGTFPELTSNEDHQGPTRMHEMMESEHDQPGNLSDGDSCHVARATNDSVFLSKRRRTSQLTCLLVSGFMTASRGPQS